jgi:hypothetical protein
MNAEERAELVAYKMARANETLAEVNSHIANKISIQQLTGYTMLAFMQLAHCL